jgi:hypothetical protein
MELFSYFGNLIGLGANDIILPFTCTDLHSFRLAICCGTKEMGFVTYGSYFSDTRSVIPVCQAYDRSSV